MWTLIAIAVIAAVVAVDQVSKLLVVSHLYEGQYKLIEGILHFTYVENDGMAFGWLSDHRWVFLIASTLGICAIGFYLFRYVERPLSHIALSLIVGGGIGNMIDRLRLGYVIDFIDFCPFDFWMWVFNVADAAVCVGAACFVLDVVLEIVSDYREQKRQKQAVFVEKPTDGEAEEQKNG